MTGHRRSVGMTIAVLVAAGFAAGCSSSQGQTTQTVAQVRQPVPRVLSAIGQTVTTANGNTVTVAAYETPSPSTPAGSGATHPAAALIKTCAGGLGARVDPRSFRALFLNRSVLDADAINPQRFPALHLTVLAPHRCTDGWVTFDVPTNAKPAYVVLTGSSLVGWRLP